VVALYDLRGRCDLFCGHTLYRQRYVVLHYQECFLTSIRPLKQCVPTVTNASLHVNDEGVGSRPRHGMNGVMVRMRRLNTRRCEERKSRILGVYLYWQRSWDSVVSDYAMGWVNRAEGPNPGKIFLFSKTPRPAARFNQPPIQCVPVSLFVGRWGLWSGRSETDQLPPSSAEVQHNFLSAMCFHEVHRGKLTCYLELADQRLRFSVVQILIWLSRSRESIKECPSELSYRN
jgi:hypothetical protein